MSASYIPTADRTSTPQRHQTMLFPSFTPSSFSHIKLPNIELSNISGNIQDWPSFINLFDASIHLDTRLQPAQKMWYLMSFLEGEAKNWVSGLKVNNLNYPIVRDTLKTRCENNRVLLGALLKRLTSLDKVHSDNLIELKKFRRDYSTVLESLKSMQIPIDT